MSTTLPGQAQPALDVIEERAQLMAALSITSDGGQYLYDGHRHDSLLDAVGARLRHARPLLTDWENLAMTTFNITFDHGAYHFLTYRYDRLSDAINYAELLKRTGRVS